MMGTEGIKLKGFYRIRLVNKKTGEIIRDYKSHNFVADAMKKIALEESMSINFKMNNGNPFGLMFCPDNGVYERGQISDAIAFNFNSLGWSDTLVLLNLDDSLTFDSTTKYLPILATDGSGLDQTKITGFSAGRLTSTDAKEGVLEPITSADMMSKMSQVANTYVFDIDKANGSFNYIGVVPGFGYTPYRGIGVFKNISNYSIRGTNSSFNNGYVGPDVKDTKGHVLTGPNEILTFERNGDTYRWIYNLVTGEKRAVQPDEFAFNWSSDVIVNREVGPMVVVGDFLYVIQDYRLYKVNIETGAQAGRTDAMWAGKGVWNPPGLFYDGQNLVCSSFTDSSNDSWAFVKIINPNNMSVISTTYNNAYTGWGNLPASWPVRKCCFTKVGNYYLVKYNSADEYNMGWYLGAVIVCTDIKNVCGSIVGIMPSHMFNCFAVGDDLWSVVQITGAPPYRLRLQENNNYTNFTYAGIYISNMNYSNFWSLSKLDQTYTKTNEMRAIIDYGYSLE